MGTLAQVGVWLSVAVFMVAAAFLLAWLRSPAWLKTRTAPSGNHPAAKALAARKTWVDKQGDQYAAGPATEVEPVCTCPPEGDAHAAVPVRLAERRAVHVADAGLFAFLADDMPDNHKVADMFDLYCAESEDRS